MDVRAGRWWRIWRGKTRSLKRNAIMYGNRLIPRRTSIALTVKRQASQAIMVRPYLSSSYTAADHTTRNSEW